MLTAAAADQDPEGERQHAHPHEDYQHHGNTWKVQYYSLRFPAYTDVVRHSRVDCHSQTVPDGTARLCQRLRMDFEAGDSSSCSSFFFF
jgi:hypothetical protein